MKKNLLIIFLSIVCLLSLSAQDTDPETITTANSHITEIRLSGFEDASFWDARMPIDQGVIEKQSRRGTPYDIANDDASRAIKKRDELHGIPRTYETKKVLGVKVQYIARGYNWFSIRPIKPIVIEGVCQSISCYVAGRNYRHLLKIFILDYFGRERQLVMDKLNFIGWKELIVSIPDAIIQTDYHFVEKQGIKFNGFIVECDPSETYGTYYIYFDELRAVTDIFNEKIQDVDDMGDDW
ncbi:MAG: flagellar filament protein FlaA [Spirochaetes bacterium]|nr:flagellar filament protein FlaA [Spirochaetota bacterium]